MDATPSTEVNEEASEMVFGSFDGVVSVVGFIFALMIAHASAGSIAIGGLGGALSATVSMTMGEYESSEHDEIPACYAGPSRSEVNLGRWIINRVRHGANTRRLRLRKATFMGIGTIVGSLVPVWPFFVFDTRPALFFAGIGCFGVASWIGFAKHRGLRGYIRSYVTVVLASAITLVVISLIPGAGG